MYQFISAGDSGISSSVAGGDFRSGFLGAGFGAFAGPYGPTHPVGQGVYRTVIGGLTAQIGGGQFSNGAVTAAFAYVFNDCTHNVRCLNSNAPKENPNIRHVDMPDGKGNWMWVPEGIAGPAASAVSTGGNVSNYMQRELMLRYDIAMEVSLEQALDGILDKAWPGHLIGCPGCMTLPKPPQPPQIVLPSFF